jgi:proliferating cell nuclear antigen
MNISITQATKCEVFSQVFQHIKLFTEHINISFRENGLYIQTMDGSHVSIFELNMPNTWFDEYTLGEEGELIIGIHSAILYRLLNSRDKAQSIKIQMPSKNSDKLFIDFECENKDIYDRHYEVSLMEIDVEQLAIPEIEYEAEFSLPSITFASLIDQFKLFGDSLQMYCSEEKIAMKAHSNETGNMNVTIPIDDILSFAIDEGEVLNLFFSLGHLHNICCYSKISKTIDIYLKKDNPLRIDYPLDEENCYIRFYLAPKIDD